MVALLLASVADGMSYLEAHAPPNTKSDVTWRDILSRQGKDFDRQLELEREWVAAARSAVNPHLEVLYEFIDHEEPQLRLAVSSALGNYPEHATGSLRLLKNAIENEAEGYVREAMQASRSRLQAQSMPDKSAPNNSL
jgi:hypothetical protein